MKTSEEYIVEASNFHVQRALGVKEKAYGLAVIIVPFAISLYALISGMLFSISQGTLVILFISYCATVLGVTIGFHRLLTHRSFKTHRYVKIIFTCLGCMSLEGPPFFWIAAHRRHHKFTDINGDPHSPFESTKKSALVRFFHAHIGWMLQHELEDWKYYLSELISDKDLRFINKHYLLIATIGLIIPGAINGLVYASWYHFYEGIIICGFFRVCLQQHVTWAINSVCHLWGKSDFKTNDNSKNNKLFAILALGEGWHNGHHAFPGSAKHGLLRFQFDITYMVIKALQMMGVAWDIKTPSTEQIEQARTLSQTQSKFN